MKPVRRLLTASMVAALTVLPSVALADVLRYEGTIVPSHIEPSGAPGPLRSGLEIVEQTWATAPGGTIRLVLDLVRSDLIPPTTTTTTTTSTTTTTTTSTSTTTSTTSTTIDPGSVGASPVDGSADDDSTTSTTTTTTIPAPDYRIQVRAHRRLESRQQAVAAVDGSHGLVIDLVELDLETSRLEERDDGSRRLVLEVPVTAGGPDADALDIVDSGVHPITVQIRRDSLPIAELTTFVELVAPNTRRGPFNIAPVASIADPGPDATERELTAAFAEVDAIGELAGRTPHPVTFAIPPLVLTALSERAPDRLARFREQLNGEDTAVVLPSEPFDPSSAAASGLAEDFATRMDLGEAVIMSLLPGLATTRSIWLVDDRLTAAGADLLRKIGVELFIVPFDRYGTWLATSARPMDPRYTDTSLLVGADIDTEDGPGTIVDVAIVDPMLDLVVDGLDDRSGLERAVEIMTLTSTTRLELGPDLRGMVLITPDLGVADAEVVTALVQLSASHPEYSWQDASRLAGSTNSFFVGGIEFVVDLDSRPSQSLTERLALVGGTRFAVDDVVSMLPDDDERTGRWRTQMRIALSTAVSDASAEERLESIVAELDEIRGALRQPEPFAFTLAGTESAIPLRIENTGRTPLRIRIHAEAAQLSFPEGDVTRVLDANATTDIEIPVSVRSNGVFPVLVEFTTPAGNPILTPISLTARVNSLTGLGRVVSVGALLVLITWWFSYFRRRRRAIVAASRDRHPAQFDGDGSSPMDNIGSL